METTSTNNAVEIRHRDTGKVIHTVEAADLRGADLGGADLGGADLRGADLRGADLHYAHIPEGGPFTAWKGIGGCVLEVEVPAEAGRTSCITSRKCRCEFARVKSITNISTGEPVEEVTGGRAAWTYRVGDTLVPDRYNNDPRTDCTNGIHIWPTRAEAEEWGRL